MKYVFLSFILILTNTYTIYGQSIDNQKINGYKGIWFELGQKSEYGDKYSGGLGTYTAKHIPMAIYAQEVNKTFFVYGGTTAKDKKHLLCMIGYYDHNTGMVPQPTVVFDKKAVDDPHDNPSMLIDPRGHIWVFISGRGRNRPGYKFRSKKPFDISEFNEVSREEMTYPQPWYHKGRGYLHLFTKYTGIRELYYETSSDGFYWSEDHKLAGIRGPEDEYGGHYQVSEEYIDKIGTFFNRHPNGNVDLRTDLYYVQTTNFGKTWTSANGIKIELPLTRIDNPARIIDFQSQSKNVYLKDLCFDTDGHPVCLYITSGGHEPGPENAPYELRITGWNGQEWTTSIVAETDHNYDMGSLYIQRKVWRIVAPLKTGPFPYSTGGEVVIYESIDKGNTWSLTKEVTKNSKLNHSYIRRPRYAQDPFYYFWADGHPHEFSQSRLYFGNSKGDVWMLPYNMQSEIEKPLKMNFD